MYVFACVCVCVCVCLSCAILSCNVRCLDLRTCQSCYMCMMALKFVASKFDHCVLGITFDPPKLKIWTCCPSTKRSSRGLWSGRDEGRHNNNTDRETGGGERGRGERGREKEIERERERDFGSRERDLKPGFSKEPPPSSLTVAWASLSAIVCITLISCIFVAALCDVCLDDAISTRQGCTAALPWRHPGLDGGGEAHQQALTFTSTPQTSRARPRAYEHGVELPRLFQDKWGSERSAQASQGTETDACSIQYSRQSLLPRGPQVCPARADAAVETEKAKLKDENKDKEDAAMDLSDDSDALVFASWWEGLKTHQLKQELLKLEAPSKRKTPNSAMSSSSWKPRSQSSKRTSRNQQRWAEFLRRRRGNKLQLLPLVQRMAHMFCFFSSASAAPFAVNPSTIAKGETRPAEETGNTPYWTKNLD